MRTRIRTAKARRPITIVDDPGAPLCASEPVGTPARAREHIVSRCFGLRPPRLVGAELEWITQCADGRRPRAAELAEALGAHAPATIAPESPQAPLPHGGTVTVEPGGQVEVSSAPLPGPEGLLAALAADASVLRGLLAARGIGMRAGAVDAQRVPERILPAARYAAMRRRFDRAGPWGAAMMCNTAAVHVSVDCGADAAGLSQRWRVLHAVGPALVAAFAHAGGGLPVGDRAPWASPRMRTWLTLDPQRTGLDPAAPGAADDPVEAYVRWALAAPLLCVRQASRPWDVRGDVPFVDWIAGAAGAPDRTPTAADLDYHLTTLFPPVRPCGHLEVRYLDGQPGEAGWRAPIAAVDALTRHADAGRRALEIALPTAGGWGRAARDGLADPALRGAAQRILEVAAEAAGGAGGADALARAAARCARGQGP